MWNIYSFVFGYFRNTTLMIVNIFPDLTTLQNDDYVKILIDLQDNFSNCGLVIFAFPYIDYDIKVNIIQ